MSHLIDRLLGLPPPLVLAVVFLLPALEASAFVGLIFPGEIAILLGGVLANEHKLSLWLVIVAGSLGAVLGDTVGYEVGRHFGDRLLAKLPRRIVKPEHIQRGHELLRRQGGRAVFIGRFTAALRALIPGLAGTSGIPYRRFLFYNVLGGVAWATETAVVGYLAGKSYRAAEHRLSVISLGLLALVVVLIIVRVLRRSERVRRFVDKYDPTRRLGRPLSLLLAVLIASTWIFFGMLQDVVDHDELALQDPRILQSFISHRTGLLTGVAKVVTTLGASPVVYVLLAATALLVYSRTRIWFAPVGALAALLLGQLVRGLMMHAVHRPRPPHELWLSPANGYAFPSGHTTTATIGFGLMAALLTLLTSSRRGRVGLVVGAVVVALGVGVSRVYLGVHWLSDVIGGWSLGVLWITLLLLALTPATRPLRGRLNVVRRLGPDDDEVTGRAEDRAVADSASPDPARPSMVGGDEGDGGERTGDR